MEKKKIQKEVEKLLNEAKHFRTLEDEKCAEIAKILIKEYGYPEDISVLYQESDGYVVSCYNNLFVDNLPIEECLKQSYKEINNGREKIY